MLLYNGDSGGGLTARIEDDGSLTQLVVLPPGSVGQWTLIGSDGRTLVFLNQMSNGGTAATMDDNGMLHPLPDRPTEAFDGWTNIAANNGWFMLYNATEGAAATGFVHPEPAGQFEFRRRFQLPPDTSFTDVVPAGWSSNGGGVDNRRFLFFDRTSGAGITYRLDPGGQVTLLTRTEALPPPFTSSGEGWSHVAAHNNEGSGRLYSFHNNTRRGTTAQVEPDGTLMRLKDGVDGFQHCTNIGDGRRLLFYDRAGGRASTVEISEDGSLHQLRELGRIGDFTHIVA
ncbi:hypothetical protein [Allorhizocola rhizosphaerae]|uniref:hypothetical protein n=1 Tax=Allorhizocola rhizosphaerae TaxID=1872709 RepID=UPI0013C375C2|nr:hypothetical protein [Allorhizocola rhizosphaerae]